MSDDYASIKGKIRKVRKDSILFTVGDSVPRGDWIPRSLIFGPDELKLDALAAEVFANERRGGVEITLKIFRWKAEQVGFITDQDDATGDLFSGGPIV